MITTNHSTKISDVSNLFGNNVDETNFTWWYRYEYLVDTDTSKFTDDDKNTIYDIFTKFGSHNHAKIAEYMLKCCKDRDMILQNTEFLEEDPDCEYTITTVISDQSILAQGNTSPDGSGFIKLFTFHCKNNRLYRIAAYPHALYPKIPLKYGTDFNDSHELQEHMQTIAKLDSKSANFNTLMPLFAKTVELKNGNIKPLHDLILLLHSKASDKFNRGLNFYKKMDPNTPGFYLYNEPSLMEIVTNMFNKKYASKCQWRPTFEIFGNDTFLNEINEKLNMIKDATDQHVVGIVIDNTISIHIVHKDAHKTIPKLTYLDRLKALLSLSEYKYTDTEEEIENCEVDTFIDTMDMLNSMCNLNLKNKKRKNMRKVNKRNK